jgi:hypothetical protein
MIDLLKLVIIIFPIEASDLYYSVVMQAGRNTWFTLSHKDFRH